MNMHENDQLNYVLTLVREELIRATDLHGPMRSSHEGYAVLKEEVDELWDNIKSNTPIVDQRKEAIQVAAMAIRFILDTAEGDQG